MAGVDIDWESIWANDYELYRKTMLPDSDDREYWSLRARDFSNARSSNDFEYGRRVLGALWGRVLTPESVVLDVGAGPGTFVVPFGRMVRRVDAVEPAPGMVDMIRENALTDGTCNFEIMNSRWEDVDPDIISGRYDLVISSLVMWVFQDVWTQLRKMEAASRGYCCIVASAASTNNHAEILWRQITGGRSPWPSISEYPLIYNILYSKGRLPNVTIIDYSYERSVEDKVSHIKMLFQRRTTVTPEIEETIRDYFTAQSRNGKVLEPGVSAVIWWRAEKPPGTRPV